MVFIQEWAPPMSAPTATSVTQAGAVTTSGSGLFARAFIRSSGTNVPAQVTVTDGVNSWAMVAQEVAGSAFVYLLHAPDAAPITSATLSWVEATSGLAYAEECLLVVSEFSDVGPLIGTSTAVILGPQFPPSLTPTEVGQLLVACGGANITSLSWTAAGSGITPTPLSGFAGQGIQSEGAYGYTADGSTPVAIGWTSSGTREFPTVNALFGSGDVVEPPPDPVDTGRYLLTATGWASIATTRL